VRSGMTEGEGEANRQNSGAFARRSLSLTVLIIITFILI
jgi:hypothetical protein